MAKDTKKIIEQMSSRLFTVSPEAYLLSEHFLRYCRKQDLEDAWKESLERARDRPDLYGDAVIKNAFVLFLLHIFHSRPVEFPALFIRFLTGFSKKISRPLPLDELKKDLMGIGYPDEDLEKYFSVLRTIEEKNRKRRTTACPD